MKTKIKVLLLNRACRIEVNPKGDWIDLHSSLSKLCPKGKFCMVPLGVCIKLPDGYEAIIAARSSTYPKFFAYNPSAIGVIDNSYCGENDEWKWLIYCCKEFNLEQGDRICQFRVQLSQKATLWQKIKWLFSSGIEIEYVNKMDDETRGGFGSTGLK